MILHHSSFWHWVIVFLLFCISIPTCLCSYLPLPVFLGRKREYTFTDKEPKILCLQNSISAIFFGILQCQRKAHVLVNTEGKDILTADFCFCGFFSPVLNFHLEQWSGVCIQHEAPAINLNEDTFPLVEEMMRIILCQWNQTFGEQLLIKIDTYNEKRA